jgi:DNA-binding SARP family transcriptional activator
MALRIHLCGRIAVVGDHVYVDEPDLPGRQGRLTFARLSLDHGRPVAYDQLIDCVWGAQPPVDASGALASIISKLRVLLRGADHDAAAVIVARFGTYELRLPTGSSVDLQDARNAIDLAEGDRRRHDVEAAWANGTVAVSIARRGFLSSETAPWVQSVSAELERVALRGLDCLRWVWTERENGVLATAMAQQAVELAPLHEPAWRALMTTQAEFGSRADALRTYRRCREVLAEELGVPPDPVTVELYQRLLSK